MIEATTTGAMADGKAEGALRHYLGGGAISFTQVISFSFMDVQARSLLARQRKPSARSLVRSITEERFDEDERHGNFPAPG